MRDDTIMTDEGSSKASGSEVVDTNNSALRNRQPQSSVQSQSTVNDQSITQNNQYISLYGKPIFIFISIVIILTISGLYIPGIPYRLYIFFLLYLSKLVTSNSELLIKYPLLLN
ncbi:hypothetical protein RclHR1_10740001 [Rhizophagus clarus]|uniref:Uncharacterized protein n=1 Tax=Rhizophagus clarus TaxID=94130 RepID=A0A2Z6Q6X6_9GLOM|nr:hypothetical protein RclHR1_10740001 [Rhizophagus clarus]